ncbi:hypothetical protein GUITHDRAFT_117068 [Guillardia theta CCMP2712]|uniref:CBM-cenC domain-containing protein n=1 Tax=Guillardia theta (strain CCMP2712) TaxID=905079 RepID=L1IKL2_GUITC|nr:hypothetical protein GUITHDRAFT_117068 [Guillardia theta CCMP2712]EKX36773.1 hypothetical protein GUITHDRAFT_117068 [Guillardia theta CCMP2712]|eukprot:XP_005823753.1 hypothetical protein GUITHDRAFT_117068 [Guillardia theta CCMP2712]
MFPCGQAGSLVLVFLLGWSTCIQGQRLYRLTEEHVETDALLNLPADALRYQPNRTSAGCGLRLESNAGVEKGFVVSGWHEGDFMVELAFCDYSILQPHAYQAILGIVLVQDNTDISSVKSGLFMKTHSDLDYTWVELNNGTLVKGSSLSPRLQSGMLRVQRRRNVLRGFLWHPGDLKWSELTYNSQGVKDFYFPGRVKVGVKVLRNYVSAYSVSLSGLYILADGDGDGLGDETELLVGSDESQVDTDQDAVTDWNDLQPKVKNKYAPPDTSQMLCCDPLMISLHCSSDKTSTIATVDNPTNSFITLSGGLSEKIVWRNLSIITASWLPPSRPWSLETISPLESTVIVISDPPPVIVAPALLRGFIVESAEEKLQLSLTSAAVDSCSDVEQVCWRFDPPANISVDHKEDDEEVVLSFPSSACGSFPIAVNVNSTLQHRSFLMPLTLFRRSSSLLTNGALEARADGGDGYMQSPPGWKFWQWEGVYAIEHTRRAAFTGNSSFMIDGKAAGKAGIFQVVELAGGGVYELTCMVASQNLKGNDWGATAELLVVQQDGKLYSRSKFMPQNSGWRKVSLLFDVPSAQTLTVYLRSFGTGIVLYDDVRLELLSCYPNISSEQFVVEEELKDVNMVFYTDVQSLVLCGFCNQSSTALLGSSAAFDSSEICRVCNELGWQQGKNTSDVKVEPRTLCNFEQGRPLPFYSSSSWSFVTDRAIEGNQSARVLAGRYIASNTELGSDWSQYGYLTFSVRNPSSSPQPVYVEIRDIYSKDYWSRVNWYTSAPAGSGRIIMPLVIFVGEKSVHQVRRQLDLRYITRLVIQAAGTSSLDIDSITLLPEPPYQQLFSRLVLLDLQPITGPLFTGFVPLTQDDWYSEARGYGISLGSRVWRSEDRRHPDNLLRDWISFEQGGVSLMLPPAKYHVWIMMEDAGYWEYFPNYQDRRVWIEGELVYQDGEDATVFWSRYYRHEEEEDLPGDDVWYKYVRKSRFVPLRFNVTCTDGQMDIQFAGSTYACTVSAIIVFPVEEYEKGETFLAELWEKLKFQFYVEYQEQISAVGQGSDKLPVMMMMMEGVIMEMEMEMEMTTMMVLVVIVVLVVIAVVVVVVVVVVMTMMRMTMITMLEFSSPFLVFHRRFNALLGAFEPPLPSEVLSEQEAINVSVSAAGEISHASFCLHALQQASVSSYSLQGFEGLDLEVSWVRFKLKRRTMDGSIYAFEPLLLDPFRELRFPQGMSRRLWIQISPSAGGGGQGGRGGCSVREVRGSVLLLLSNSAQLKVDVVVRVLPFSLPWVDDLLLGWLGTAVTYPLAPYPEVRVKQKREMNESIELLRSYGGTGATGGVGGPKLVEVTAGGGVVMQFEDADMSMAAIRASFGKKEVNSYAGLAVQGVNMYAPTMWMDAKGRTYEDVVSEVVQQIEEHASERDWPGLTLNVGTSRRDRR